MNETPSGPMTGSILRLERMLLDCPAFVQRVRGDNELEWRESIKLFEYEDDPELLKKARPFAAIWPADALDFREFAGGEKNWLRGGGELVLMLTDNDRFPADTRAAWFDFVGWVDTVFMDIKKRSGRDQGLDVSSLKWMHRPAHSERSEPRTQWYFWCALLVGWGGGD